MSLMIEGGPGAGGHGRGNEPDAAWRLVLSGGLGRLSAVLGSMTWVCRQPALADLDEHLLRDIGLTRMEVRCATPAAHVDAGTGDRW